MEMIGQDDVGADIRAVLFTAAGKILEAPMNRGLCENRTPTARAGRDEINRGADKDSIEATQTLFALFVVVGVGGHRPPLQ